MSFSAPWNLLWLAPTAGAITLLYLLRRPRKNITVPSSLFWRSIQQQTVQAKKLQRFVPQLLYFLQILAAILLVLALAGPQMSAQRPPIENWAIVLDNSGSMNANDLAPSRLEAARAAALQFINTQTEPNDRIALISASGNGELVAALGTDRSLILSALQSIKPTDLSANLPASVSLTSGVIKNSAIGKPGGIIIFTDGSGSFTNSDISKAAGNIPIISQIFGQSNASNCAITRLTVEKDPSAPDSRLAIFAEIKGFGYHGNITGTISFTVGHQNLSKQRISITPNTPDDISFTMNTPKNASILDAQFETSALDNLSNDNHASVVLPAAGSTKILLVSDGDPDLEKALTLIPGTVVDETSSASFSTIGAPAGYDLYVIDSDTVSVSALTLPGNSLIFGGAEPSFKIGSPDIIARQIVDWDRVHPVARFIDLSNLSLKTAEWSDVGVWSKLVETGQGTVIAAYDQQGRRSIRAAFTPPNSGLTGEEAFPILISNAVSWLSEQPDTSDIVGKPITLAPIKSGWRITGPNGIQSSGLCSSIQSANCSFNNTANAGVYTATSSEQTLQFARVFDPLASDITLKPHDLGTSAPTFRDVTRHAEKIDLTPWAILIVFISLIAEWAVYFRRKS